MYKRKHSNSGFSLIELIAVICILAILAVVLAPVLLKYIERAREISDINDMHNAKTMAKLMSVNGKLTDKEGVMFYDTKTGDIVTGEPEESYGLGTSTDGGSEYENGYTGCGCEYIPEYSYQNSYITVFVDKNDVEKIHTHWVGAGSLVSELSDDSSDE